MNRVRFFCLLAVTSLGGLMSLPLLADEPTSRQLREWITNLGENSYAQRELAAQRLIRAGDAAIEPLQRTSQSPDREVRERAKKILSTLQRRRRDGIVSRFRKGEALADAMTIPGWKTFSQQYGQDALARKLYAEMLQAEWSLLTAVFTTEKKEKTELTAIARRLEQVQRVRSSRYRPTDRGTVITFFFLASRFPEEVGEHGQFFTFFTPGQEISRTLVEAVPATKVKSERQLIRRIVGDWLLNATKTNHLDDRHGLQVTLLYRMRDVGSTIGQRVLKTPDSSAMSKDMAMQAIVLRGDVEQAPLIEKYLSDTTVLGSNEKRQRQLRDVALACLMKLHGHDLSLIDVRPGRATLREPFEYSSIGYATEAERTKALRVYHRLQEEKRRRKKQASDG